MDASTSTNRKCFIIGPIGEAGSEVRRLADWLLKGVIKPVLENEEFGYLVKRADDDTNPGSITNAVISDLTNADLVIAELTGFNPNAFYELGIRHTIRKPVIHIIAEQVKLPFDNADQRTIFVDIGDIDNVQAAKARLTDAVRSVSAEGYQVTNPVTLANAVSEFRQSGDPEKQMVADIAERLGALERNIALLMVHNRNTYSSGRSSRASELLNQFGRDTPSIVESLAAYGIDGQALEKAKSSLASKNLNQSDTLDKVFGTLTGKVDNSIQGILERAIAETKKTE